MNPEIISKLTLSFLYMLRRYFIRRWSGFSTRWVAQSLFYVFVLLVVFKGVVCSDIRPFLILVFLSFFVSMLIVISAGFFTNSFVSTLSPGDVTLYLWIFQYRLVRYAHCTNTLWNASDSRPHRSLYRRDTFPKHIGLFIDRLRLK